MLMALKLSRLYHGSSGALPDKSLDSRKHDERAKKESMGAHADATTGGHQRQARPQTLAEIANF
jgi:hypothetical protein